MLTPDPHSYARPSNAQVRHLALHLTVDFASRTLAGHATWTLDNHTDATELWLDARHLEIEAALLGGPNGETTMFALGADDPILGQALRVGIRPDTTTVTLRYRTTPGAAALQWLMPEQTAGRQHPFLFTQSQAILARTWIPCQDSPGIRFTYEATIKCPAELLALMSAENPQTRSADGEYQFRMAQPIPAYLMALAVGDVEFTPLSTRTGIYAEPVTLPTATHEFVDLEKMVGAAEELYGPYRWDRYDLLVLPPSFPFGGMENPRLTFVTPTILAGDRSLTSLVAHELAHSWSGNLVTNATWNDFWLNEGFTVYFERRIMEKLYGRPYADMLQVLGHSGLLHTLEELGPESKDTHLHLDLAGRDPDEGLNDIAYEKGDYLLLTLEHLVGREKLDTFIKEYFARHSFQSMDTVSFVAYLRRELLDREPGLEAKLQLDAWINGPGIPAVAPPVSSARFAAVEAARQHWQAGRPAAALDVAGWSSHEWVHFLHGLPQPLSVEQVLELDAAFGFTQSGNAEILAAWFPLTIAAGYAPADEALHQFLTRVGRRKFLTPLYKALLQVPGGRERAQDLYAEARPNYHSVATSTFDALLGRPA
ncbi:Leukotriene A4 hydrolase, C-terminal [Hymenobacter daecheongensis DSM 21074]|uniref:Aminopeptidase N n=1 Tax=Hymenobacter daecheongensis DSM 21074 TaxID=1121955 RepID=A0A1M6HSW5_9BACT|nr:M1 family metallopeptidase [Hymenobacter daecheongensis]SHJ25291.1 Leukotriene A4 hydrolase, C-terminal [Hymenobacter daecheongensis DSM 21074]